MKIVIIGTINKDLIFPFHGSSIESFGGIFYSLSALHSFVDDSTTIYPVSFIGNDVYSDLLSVLKELSRVDPTALILIDQPNHKVVLKYHSPEERSETALFNFPTLEWQHIKNMSQANFYVINMITGWDLSLEAFQKLSNLHYSNIYLDIHFLVMGIDAHGKRFPLCPENISSWLKGARFVQMNQREFSIINQDELNLPGFFEKYFQSDQYLIITQGSRGANLVFRKNSMIISKHFPAVPLSHIVDVTGCGDVFGVGFIWSYLQDEDVYRAVEFANRAAAAKCLLPGTNEMDKLGMKIKALGRL